MRMLRSTLAFVVAATIFTGGVARAQFGAGGVGGGVANRAVGQLVAGSEDAPGWMYYGINAADRGLGYVGSYATLGGFIPYAEDDLGGLWAADLRGHLSVNGGFFSNVGAVRKQFLGGSLLGIGVYWDYDGDLNQYPVWGQPGTEVFGQFGHVYNQVGVSGEWLTDFGNLRSNGYIPVGTTAHTLGAPGSPFASNYLLCQYGLDAALSGADLEVGAYVPGLADWAGMISVGGYALGNARYDWNRGSLAGRDVVPWFGGVYTRLDLTLIRNWDFSLQYNNDSYFDSTGFARLTYRMGGSRRRNVPDQMEQPMMRNEHIVRAHQTPVVAYNPATNQPWNVIHVDNSAVRPGADGTIDNPWISLAAAQADATQPYDIVFVRAGDSAVSPYTGEWQFQADNQILVGEGSTLELLTSACGYRQFFTAPSGVRPVLASNGTAITLRDGAIVDHLRIQNAPVAIVAGPSVTGTVNVNDVELVGTGTPGDVGIVLSELPAGARANLLNMNLQNMDLGLYVDAGAADVDFQGLMVNSNSALPSLLIENTTGGIINVNRTTDTLQTPVASNQAVVVPFGIVDTSSLFATAISVQQMTDTVVNIGQTRIVTPTQAGVQVASNIGSEVRFFNLGVESAANEAFISQANDAASLVAITGSGNRLSSASAAVAAFTSNDAAQLNIQLVSLESKVPPGTNAAIDLQGTSTGTFTITDEFLVSGTPGTDLDDVTNATGVVVTVPVP